MQVSGDTRAGGLAQVHSNVEAVRMVEAFERLFGALRQLDQFRERRRRQEREAVHMGVGHPPSRGRRCRGCVQTDKAMLAAQDEAAGGFGFVRVHSI